MEDLFIILTGPHSQETVDIINRINKEKATWNLIGFIDPDENKIGETLNQTPVIGGLDVLEKYPNAKCVPGMGYHSDAVDKEKYVTIIDPSTTVSQSATIGTGAVIYPNCFIGLNVKIGDLFFSLSNSVINHDDVIGDKVVVCTGVTLAGGVTVGDNAYIGQSCTIRQDLKIGNNALVGMGSVVVRNVEPNTIVAGNPAKFLKNKKIKETEDVL